jgi:hypothetical protein
VHCVSISSPSCLGSERCFEKRTWYNPPEACALLTTWILAGVPSVTLTPLGTPICPMQKSPRPVTWNCGRMTTLKPDPGLFPTAMYTARLVCSWPMLSCRGPPPMGKSVRCCWTSLYPPQGKLPAVSSPEPRALGQSSVKWAKETGRRDRARIVLDSMLGVRLVVLGGKKGSRGGLNARRKRLKGQEFTYPKKGTASGTTELVIYYCNRGTPPAAPCIPYRRAQSHLAWLARRTQPLSSFQGNKASNAQAAGEQNSEPPERLATGQGL